MTAVKEMSHGERFDLVRDNIALYESFVPEFVEERLGQKAVQALHQEWQRGLKPIPEGASDNEKYELAYSNMIWMARCNFDLVRREMGEEGLRAFERAEAEALKRQAAGLSVSMLKLMRAVAPGLAFKMTADTFAYQLQWLTPYSVSELNKQKFEAKIPSCKILDYEGTDDVCTIGCQRVYPMWVEEQFAINMAFDRQGKSCTCTVTPFN